MPNNYLFSIDMDSGPIGIFRDIWRTLIVSFLFGRKIAIDDIGFPIRFIYFFVRVFRYSIHHAKKFFFFGPFIDFSSLIFT